MTAEPAPTVPRVALALGSGGARGYAHIGVIDALRDRGHEIVALSGTSMGAVVGGMYAAGALDGFRAWVTGLTQRDVLRYLDPKWSAPGAITADKLVTELTRISGNPRIEDFAIPFTAVATSLDDRREIWFQHGPLVPAVRASLSIPGVFTPVVADGRVLADGGLVNPVPMEPLAAARADLVIAVSLDGATRTGPSVQVESTDDAARTWRTRLTEAVVEPLRRGRTEQPMSWPEDLHLLDVTSRSLETLEAIVARYRFAAFPPDVHVVVPKSAAGTLELHRANEMIDLGRTLAEQALDAHA